MLWKIFGNVKTFLDKCRIDNITAFAAQIVVNNTSEVIVVIKDRIILHVLSFLWACSVA